ncbi:MAG TPA: ABC transporter ATP-binding protein [Nitrolancea sp.]|nr:ABC transporter ATP-binding protein [Nitrolancea sp.]
MIEATALSRRFDEFVAVDKLDLSVPDGTILALLGPNGAGKTTTVRMLAGLLAPSSGTASVAGCDIRSDPAGVRARIGLVTDVPGLYAQMTLPAYLEFFGQIYGLGGERLRKRVAELIDFFELTEHRRERMVGFSKGMKQKVALARALLHEPDVLFLDEPTSGLDPLAARAVRDLIVSLKHARRTIVLCTHDLGEAERLADEIAIIQHGRLVVHGSPSRLRLGASPDTLVRIELAQPCAGAIDVVARHPDLIAPVDSIVGDHAVLSFRTRYPEAVNPEIISQLVTLGARIVAVNCETRSLEDVYSTMVTEPHATTANFISNGR